jgi:hypothetical protein
MSDMTSESASASPRPRLSASPFFWLNLLVAAGLLALLLVSPFVPDSRATGMVRLFSQDSTVRKTALAGAIGLAVTAFVFFRSRSADPTPPLPRTPPSNVVGA